MAVYCQGEQPIAEVRGTVETGGDALERSLWVATGRLFPDDYESSYGFNLFGNRISLGGWFGS